MINLQVQLDSLSSWAYCRESYRQPTYARTLEGACLPLEKSSRLNATAVTVDERMAVVDYYGASMVGLTPPGITVQWEEHQRTAYLRGRIPIERGGPNKWPVCLVPTYTEYLRHGKISRGLNCRLQMRGNRSMDRHRRQQFYT